MRILVTSPHAVWPADSGPAVRTSSIARTLSEMEHQVTILHCGGPMPAAAAGTLRSREYQARGRFGHFFNRDFRRVYREALAERPALVVSSYPYQALMLVGPAARARIPIVYDAQNVEARRFRDLGHPLRARLVRRMESLLCSRARAVLAVTPEDQGVLERDYRCRTILLPNGVDVARFCPAPPDESLVARYGLAGRRVVLYFGALDYPPNLDALRFLLREAWPLLRRRVPSAALLVVGRRPPGWARGISGVVVTGATDDIVAHVRLAHVVAVPLRSGGGMRLKIVEALACGQTVLSTPFGATGFPSSDEGALARAGLEDFASRLVELLEDPPTPGSNDAARRLAMSFDWRPLVAAVDWEALASPV